jgi:hypothetical protein
MALAIKLEAQLREEPSLTISDVAALGHVTSSRVRQILNLLVLAPDIQERILFLNPVAHGREPVTEAKLRHIALMWDWAEQRRAVEPLLGSKR